MKLLATLTALLIAASTQAEVLVYKQNYVVKQTGLGSVKNIKFSGYFIVDTDAGRLISLDAQKHTFPLGKNKMRVEEYNFESDTVDGGAIKDFWVITMNFADATKSAPLLKGRVSMMVEVGSPDKLINWMDIPKSLALSGFSKGVVNGQPVLLEYKGRFVFDGKTTRAQNRAGNDADATLAALKSILGAKHYVLVENWND